MKTVYIAGPFRGPDGYAVHMNVTRILQVAHDLIEAALKQGTPISVCIPHTMTEHLDRTFTDDYWLEATMEQLDRQDSILMTEGWEKSVGSQGEKARAEATGKAIHYSIEDVLRWLIRIGG